MSNRDSAQILCPYCGEQIAMQVDIVSADEDYVLRRLLALISSTFVLTLCRITGALLPWPIDRDRILPAFPALGFFPKESELDP